MKKFTIISLFSLLLALFFNCISSSLPLSVKDWNKRERLSPDFKNFYEFSEDLFHPYRGEFLQNEINNSFKNFMAWLISKKEKEILLDKLESIWSETCDLSTASLSDYKLVTFLKKYITYNNLFMFKPKLSYLGTEKLTGEQRAQYSLDSYEKLNILDREYRKEFFKLFLAGSHFVVVQKGEDSKEGKIKSFVNHLKNQLKTSYAFSHSHYTSFYSLFGLYYPHALNDPKAIIKSFLTDTTAFYKGNSFFQLEGWPAYKMPYGQSKRDIVRHRVDYNVHLESKWNISTYGASIYHEKRGTAIFLAPENWNPNSVKERRGKRDIR